MDSEEAEPEIEFPAVHAFDQQEIAQIRYEKRRKKLIEGNAESGFREDFSSYLAAAKEAEEDDPNENAEEGVIFEPFNMRQEMTEGKFDKEGNYIWNKQKKKEFTDSWLDAVDAGLSSTSFKDEDHRQRIVSKTEEPLEKPKQIHMVNALQTLVSFLKRGEAPVAALKRFKKDSLPQEKSPVSRRKRKAAIGSEGNGQAETIATSSEGISNTSILSGMDAFNAVTEICDALLDYGINAYFMPREDLEERLEQPFKNIDFPTGNEAQATASWWRFRWLGDETLHGPYDSACLLSWIQQGYISDEHPIEVQRIPPEGEIPEDTAWNLWNTINFVNSNTKEKGDVIQSSDSDGGSPLEKGTHEEASLLERVQSSK
ncbi:hypothetical protein IE077_002326 [Cardiosporidium cionae]|uniref:GYF domain-containing protein n=1 Tax=Cardiosporidium cionae TaxID=476202 RepID=A0ABQ7JB80_9APIC|nr:hypothetical protein IE077_002326 [Cardiosporidium cionae]|eukprot:KAF8821205.1 hypothetical protein IE077_002326 [Cardiosporidium cionae]